ncbi:MAG: VIT domain-containing protein [bacterium]
MKRNGKRAIASRATLFSLVCCVSAALCGRPCPVQAQPVDRSAAAGAPEAEPGPGTGEMLAVPQGGKEPVPLPLRHTRMEAHLTGIVGTVSVEQVFGNPYDKPIEAVYVFPLPHDAAVYAMRMRIGERTVEGEIKRREEAQELYRQARQAGKTASLLDQERPNIFTQSVANILPGDDIRVEISYFHDITYREGRYELVFPMVVGPRYIPGNASGRTGSGWSPDTDRVADASRISPPLLPPGVRSGHDIELVVDLDAGVPIRDLETPSHAIQVARQGPSRAVVTLAANDRIPNKDFVLRWKTDTKGPVAGWMAHNGELGGYFLMVIQPDARIPRSETVPREYVFVIDTSGSMHGFPLDQCKRVLEKCLADLDGGDTFQVVLFAGAASTFAPGPVAATAENVRRALEYANAAGGGGGTEFLPALEKALNQPEDPKRSRIVLFLSDGYIGYEAEVLKYMREHRGRTNLFPLGVGTSVNRYLIDAMARVGQGEPFYITPDENPDEVVERFFAYVSRPALTHVELEFQGIEVLEPMPARLPDLFAGRPLSVVGKYDDAGRGKVVLRGWLAGKAWQQTLEVELPESAPGNPGLARLWARRAIEEWSDRQAVREIAEETARKQVTELALRYSLMSAYTSFVAIDSQVRNTSGDSRTVAVPVPLPDQVSPLAAPPHAYAGGAVAMQRTMGFSVCEERKAKCADRAAPAESALTGPDGSAPAATAPDKEKAAARLRVAGVRVKGGIEEQAARSVLEEALEKWSEEQALSSLRGTLVLALEILPDGKVGRAWTRDERLVGEAPLEKLLERARGLVFPASEVKSVVLVELAWEV